MIPNNAKVGVGVPKVFMHSLTRIYIRDFCWGPGSTDKVQGPRSRSRDLEDRGG